MPNHSASIKAVRKTKKANERNRTARTRLRGSLKAVLEAKTKADGEKALVTAFSILDKAAKTGLIHKNNANNHKSRLTLTVAKLAA